MNGSIVIEECSPDGIRPKASLNGSGILMVANSCNPYLEVLGSRRSAECSLVDGAFRAYMRQGAEMNVTLDYLRTYRSFY